MIRRRKGAWEVVVFAGRDPITGKERRVSRSVPGSAGQNRPPKEARDLEARLRTEVAAGRHREAHATVGEFLDRWIEHIRPDSSPYTIQGYEGIIARYLKPHIGNVALAKVTTSMLDGLYRSLRASGGKNGRPLAPGTIRHTHAVVRQAFNQAERWEWVTRNPARLASPPKGYTSEVQPPDIATIGHIISSADASSIDFGDWIVVALVGIRRGEMAGLRWADLDLDAGTVKITRAVIQVHRTMSIKDPKTERARRGIALPGFVVARLRARRERVAETFAALELAFDESAYVFSETYDGATPLAPDTATQRFSRLMDRLGLPYRLHDLRHAAATITLAAGVPVRTVAASLGHAQPSMTLNVYGHATAAGYLEFAEALDRALGGGA